MRNPKYSLVTCTKWANYTCKIKHWSWRLLFRGAIFFLISCVCCAFQKSQCPWTVGMCCWHSEVSRGWREQTSQCTGTGCGLETPSPSQDTLQGSSLCFQNSGWLFIVLFWKAKLFPCPWANWGMTNSPAWGLWQTRENTELEGRLPARVLSNSSVDLVLPGCAETLQNTSTRPSFISKCRLDWSRGNKAHVHPYFD